jgi:hypothetical protein
MLVRYLKLDRKKRVYEYLTSASSDTGHLHVWARACLHELMH